METMIDYLKEKVQEGPYKPDDPEVFHEFMSPDASLQTNFADPFKIFVCTVWDIHQDEYYTHETNWPMASWHANFKRVGKIITSLQEDDADEELVDLVQRPVFVHVGPASPDLVPVTSAGPGVSPWGVTSAGDEEFESQQDIWNSEPYRDGPHAWRLLAGADIFYPLPGDRGRDISIVKRLLRSASQVYESVAFGDLRAEHAAAQASLMQSLSHRDAKAGALAPRSPVAVRDKQLVEPCAEEDCREGADNGLGTEWVGHAIDQSAWRQLGHAPTEHGMGGSSIDQAAMDVRLNKMGISHCSDIAEEDVEFESSLPEGSSRDDCPPKAELLTIDQQNFEDEFEGEVW